MLPLDEGVTSSSMGDVALCNSPNSRVPPSVVGCIAIVSIEHRIIVILGQEELTAHPPNLL